MSKLKLYRVNPEINKEYRMSFNAREAADRLLAIADHIERQAALSSFFVCDGCNKIASLEEINSSRAKYASEHSGISSVRTVTISDTVSCTACHGDMKYAATEGSEKFFVTAADDDEGEIDFGELDDANNDAESGSKDDESGDGIPDSDIPADGDEEGDDAGAEDTKDEDTKDEAPKSPDTKATKKPDDEVSMREEPEAQFGDDDKKTRAKTAFDKAVERYSL